MASNHNLRFAKIPLSFGTGTILALGFGTLIPNLAETRSATTNALRVGFRHLNCAYWTAMVIAPKAAKFAFECRKPSVKMWQRIQPPIPDCRAGFEISVHDETIGVYLGSYNSDKIEALRHLYGDHEAALKEEVGEKSNSPTTAESRKSGSVFMSNQTHVKSMSSLDSMSC